MKQLSVNARAWKGMALVVMLGLASQANAQATPTPYPSMAPLEQYLMDRNSEIALAQTAAPESISRDADVLVLGRHGYETALKELIAAKRAGRKPPAAPAPQPSNVVSLMDALRRSVQAERRDFSAGLDRSKSMKRAAPKSTPPKRAAAKRKKIKRAS